MKTRNVELVASPKTPHFVGDGFRVHNFIPSGFRLDMQRMDPFILLDYNAKFKFDASDQPKGVGVHPHRGFETVTIAYQGKVQHHDSHGGGGIISEGDVQWMTAAGGVLHKEYHEKEWSRQGGIFQMVQLWVNLPRKDKMGQPNYQSISNKDIPKYQLQNNQGVVEIIAGNYQGLQGIAKTFSPINIYNVQLNTGGIVEINTPIHYNTALLIIEGDVMVNETENAPTDHFVLMANDGERFQVKAVNQAKILVLSGEPLQEPIVAHGPFVMNSKAEILQAFEDFYSGKFGYLED